MYKKRTNELVNNPKKQSNRRFLHSNLALKIITDCRADKSYGDRSLSNESERQKVLEKELNCVFVRINPDEKNFNIYREINKIHRHAKKRETKDLKEENEKLKLDNEEFKKENKELKTSKNH